MYARMETGISAEFVQFVSGEDFQIGRGAPHYLLRPEAFESFFILNHLTGDPIYREWGWECFSAIERYCKTDIAYGSLPNVANIHGDPENKMESFFLAETLKYLFLLQDPDSEIDLVRNTTDATTPLMLITREYTNPSKFPRYAAEQTCFQYRSASDENVPGY
jgi:Glycosyl hydrolase family 47